MRFPKLTLLPAVALLALASHAPRAKAQVSIGIGIGEAPVCPYGYYGYAPYHCAPYGFYGPEWFNQGAFVGAGPWYHGDPGWHGPVDYHYDERHGYGGPYPGRDEHWRAYGRGDFHGNEMHDFHGNVYGDHHHDEHR